VRLCRGFMISQAVQFVNFMYKLELK